MYAVKACRSCCQRFHMHLLSHMLWGFLLQLMRGNSRQLLFLKEELIDKKVSAVHQVLRMRCATASLRALFELVAARPNCSGREPSVTDPRPLPIAPSVCPDLCQACQTDQTLARPRSASFRCVAVVAPGHPSAKG